MKNIILSLLLWPSVFSFAGPMPDKCDEDTKTKVHFKLTHDRKSDVVTKTGKNVNISVEVNNASGANVSAKIDFYVDGKQVSSFVTQGNVAAGAKATVANKVNVANGKKIDNIIVTLKNADCADAKKSTQTLLTTNNEEVRKALYDIGF